MWKVGSEQHLLTPLCEDQLDPEDPVDPGMGSLFRILGVFCDRSETLTPPEPVFAPKVFFLGEKNRRRPPAEETHAFMLPENYLLEPVHIENRQK